MAVDNDDKLLQKWCKDVDVDYKLARKLKAKIFPLHEEAHKQLGYKFDKAYNEQRIGTEIRQDNAKTILLLLKKLNPDAFSIKENGIITLHLEYLTLVEGLFSTRINFLIFILISNGHDLYSSRKGGYAITLTDIEEVNLGFKLKFLGEHGFSNLISNKVDIKLRNSVAHLFYEIDADKSIKFGKKRITQSEYRKLYIKLRHVTFALHLINLLYYKRFESMMSPRVTKFDKIKCSCGYENIVPNIKHPPKVEPLTCTNCGKPIKNGK